MIGCLPTQALPFEWKPGLSRRNDDVGNLRVAERERRVKVRRGGLDLSAEWNSMVELAPLCLRTPWRYTLSRVYTRIHVAGYKLYPLVAVLYRRQNSRQFVVRLLLDTMGYKSTVT